MSNTEQKQPRPEFIDELYKNSEPLTVQRYTGSMDCITYITTEKAIQIFEKYISRPIEQQVDREVGEQYGGELRDSNKFLREIADVINRTCVENDSNTPDFILAEYVKDCLDIFAKTSRAREKWYGKFLHI